MPLRFSTLLRHSLPAAAVVLAACGDGATAPAPATSVSLSLAAATGVAGGEPLVLADGVHLLAMTRVRLVVKAVSLRSSAGGPCPASQETAGCRVLATGPFVLEVPLDGGVRPLVAAAVPGGLYDGVGLTLHPLSAGDPADAALLEQVPELEGVSVRVEGTWDGAPFGLGRALEEEREMALVPALDLRGRTVNVTLRLDLTSWFRDVDGFLVAPAAVAADPALAQAADTRIRTSFQAFEDPDADGVAGGR